MVTVDSELRDGLNMIGDSVDIGAVMWKGDVESALAVDMAGRVGLALCRCLSTKLGNSKKKVRFLGSFSWAFVKVEIFSSSLCSRFKYTIQRRS
jgi:hypothetical protein